MPDLGTVTDDASVVGEHAGSGRFTAAALRDYALATAPWATADTALVPKAGGSITGTFGVTGNTTLGPHAVMTDFGVPKLGAVADSGAQNCLIGEVTNSLAPGTVAYPTGVTGYGKLTTLGGQVFGLFGRADLATPGVGGTAVNEVDSFNFAGMPSGTMPPNTSFGTTDYCAIALQVVAYGDYPSLAGITVLIGSQPFQYGIYCHPQAASSYSLFLDADATHMPTGATAVIRNSGSLAPALILQTKGAPHGLATVLSVQTDGGLQQAGINQSGDFINTGFELNSSGLLNFKVASVSPSATTGANGDVPAQVAGYVGVQVSGTQYKIPLYNI